MSDASEENLGWIIQPTSSSRHPSFDCSEICESIIIKEEELTEFDPPAVVFPDLVKCVLCPRQGTVTEILEHVKISHPHLCRVCGIDFKRRLNFTKHCKQHNFNRFQFFNCIECKAEFRTIDLIKTHHTEAHPNKSNKIKIYSRTKRKFVKPSPPGEYSLDCPFCESHVLLADFHYHLSTHTVSSCCKCSSTLIDMNSTSQLCVVCSQKLYPEPKLKAVNRGKSRKNIPDLSFSESHCGVCDTPKRGPQCAVCKPRSTRVCLSLSEFSECERRCTECRATLWSYKFIQICLNCLPRDVASLDINLSIVPQPLPKPKVEKPKEEAKLLNHTVTSTSSIADDDHVESLDDFTIEPQSPEANPDEVIDFDEASSEPPWIDTAPDADWTMAPVSKPPPSTPCDYCEGMFYGWSKLRPHMKRTHPEFKKWICGWCSQKAPSRETFFYHRLTHNSDFGHLCNFCGDKFANATLLARHIIVRHPPSAAKKLICNVCNKRYNNEWHLKIHKKTHRESRIQCEHCCKKFKTKMLIESHMQTHTGVFMFQCKMCMAKFTRQDNLNQHMKNNHNFACPICDLTLPTAAEVRRHRGEAHTREQLEASQAQGEGEFVRFTPFQCEVCFRFLSSKQSLDKHLTTHTRPDRNSDPNRKPAESGIEQSEFYVPFGGEIASEQMIESGVEHGTCETGNRKRKSDQILPPVADKHSSVNSNKWYQDFI